MPLGSKANRFAVDQCCGTAIIRLVSTITGVFCVVSKDCGEDCFPSGQATSCIRWADLEDGDEVEVYCRPDCVYGHPAFVDPCSGDPPPDPCDSGECPEGYTGCTEPDKTCFWQWAASGGGLGGGLWLGADSCLSIFDPGGGCECKCRPNRDGAYDGEIVDGKCCQPA